jgi:hypothetical protein
MMTITLPSDIELRLKGEASRHGLDAADFARKLIVENLPPVQEKQSIDALFAKWNEEDRTDDLAEIARRQQEFEEFKQAMNRNRLEMEGPDSRKPFP